MDRAKQQKYERLKIKVRGQEQKWKVRDNNVQIVFTVRIKWNNYSEKIIRNLIWNISSQIKCMTVNLCCTLKSLKTHLYIPPFFHIYQLTSVTTEGLDRRPLQHLSHQKFLVFPTSILPITSWRVGDSELMSVDRSRDNWMPWISIDRTSGTHCIITVTVWVACFRLMPPSNMSQMQGKRAQVCHCHVKKKSVIVLLSSDRTPLHHTARFDRVLRCALSSHM